MSLLFRFVCLALTPIFAAFYSASSFNQDVSSWDTSKVTLLSSSKSVCVSVLCLLLFVVCLFSHPCFCIPAVSTKTCGTRHEVTSPSKSVCVCVFVVSMRPCLALHPYLQPLERQQFQPRRVLMGHVQSHFSL